MVVVNFSIAVSIAEEVNLDNTDGGLASGSGESTNLLN